MAKLKDIYDEDTRSIPYINIATKKTRRVSTPIRTKKKERQERLYVGLIRLNTATTENETELKRRMESYGVAQVHYLPTNEEVFDAVVVAETRLPKTMELVGQHKTTVVDLESMTEKQKMSLRGIIANQNE